MRKVEWVAMACVVVIAALVAMLARSGGGQAEEGRASPTPPALLPPPQVLVGAPTGTARPWRALEQLFRTPPVPANALVFSGNLVLSGLSRPYERLRVRVSGREGSFPELRVDDIGTFAAWVRPGTPLDVTVLSAKGVPLMLARREAPPPGAKGVRVDPGVRSTIECFVSQIRPDLADVAQHADPSLLAPAAVALCDHLDIDVPMEYKTRNPLKRLRGRARVASDAETSVTSSRRVRAAVRAILPQLERATRTGREGTRRDPGRALLGPRGRDQGGTGPGPTSGGADPQVLVTVPCRRMDLRAGELVRVQVSARKGTCLHVWLSIRRRGEPIGQGALSFTEDLVGENGRVDYTWDGRADDGRSFADGTYRFYYSVQDDSHRTCRGELEVEVRNGHANGD